MCYTAAAPRMKLHLSTHLTLQHFYDMEALELQFYDAEFITPPEESYRWYLHHPHSTVAATDGKRLIGFVNLFPVLPEVYEALRAGTFNDHFLEMEHMAPLTAQPLHMFLCCVVVAREYQHQGIARQLLQAAVQPYASLPCTSVITDNVTADGCAFSARYGFTRLRRSDHDSWIYEQAWPDFVKRVTGCSPRAL